MPVGDADRIRRYLFRKIENSRMAGRTRITFRAGDVHDAVGLSGAVPNVCQVLESEEKFRRPAGLQFIGYVYRPPSGQGRRLEIEFGILPVSSRNLSSVTEPEDGIDENLREYIMRLTPGEFQELAHQYLKAKGFDGAEIEISIQMKV